MDSLKKINQKIEDGVVDGYKAIEKGVVDGYKKIEQGVVEGYKKIEDKFIDTFFAKEGESTQQAKERLVNQAAKAKDKENA